MDLFVLVADGQMQATVNELLSVRCAAIGIPQVDFAILVHPGKDPGVYTDPCTYLEGYRDAGHALVLLDCAWEGAPPGGRAAVEAGIRKQLRSRSMNDWAEVVAIEPELEVWVWADSPHVADAVAWPEGSLIGPRQWLESEGLWDEGAPKPGDPKLALEALCKQQRIPRSAAIFRHVARYASIRRCTDESFLRFCGRLREWYHPDFG